MSGEILALLAKSGGVKASKRALEKLLSDRAEQARLIIVDRLSKGKANLNDLPEDEAAAVVYRYLRAAEEGASRANLKLLADVAAGIDGKPGFYANEFLNWAGVLSSLRRDEIIVLGIMHRRAYELSYEIPQDGEFWSGCLRILEVERSISSRSADVVAASLLRTGLVTILGGLADVGHAYLPSENLRKLGEMADLESCYMDEPFVG